MVVSLNYKKSAGPRECPREVSGNTSKVINSVFCSYGCCPGDGGNLWKCCPDPNLVRNPALENWNWCTTFLLIIILLTIITLFLIASCFAVVYSRGEDHHRRPLPRSGQPAPVFFSEAPYFYLSVADAWAEQDMVTLEGRYQWMPLNPAPMGYTAYQMMGPVALSEYQTTLSARDWDLFFTRWIPPALITVCLPDDRNGPEIEEVDKFGAGDKPDDSCKDHVTGETCASKEGKGDLLFTDNKFSQGASIPEPATIDT
uniref:Uncharacterized protein n=1 Tax=Biomphalaria glabrata TaxID=6526 RepID=A0A2C9LR48_BIOGL